MNENLQFTDTQIIIITGLKEDLLKNKHDVVKMAKVLSTVRDIKNMFDQSYPVKIVKDIVYKEWLGKDIFNNI